MTPVTDSAPTDDSTAGGAPTGAPPRRTGAETRALIEETALRLLLDRGYGGTTMRLIAAEAGVSVGNAYHYVPSKEHLVQAFYDRVQTEHVAASVDVLAPGTGAIAFADRLRGVLLAWLDVATPYRSFAGAFFSRAAEPESPLSPFSEQSRPAREASTAIFRDVVEGSDLRTSTEVRAELPELLWLMHLGIVLFWVHDRSDGAARSRTLVRRVVPIVDRLTTAARLPVLRPVVRDLMSLARDLRDVPDRDRPA